MTGREVDRIPAGAPPAALDFGEMLRRAQVLANSGLVPSALRGKPEAVALVGARGAELGVPFVTSLSEIHVIEGRPTPSAQLRIAIFRRAGHEVRFPTSTSSRCVIRGRRKEDRDDPDAWTEVEWTIEDAQRAGLTNKDVWKRYPAAMLTARAICALGRLLFSDVLLGMGVDPHAEDDESFAASTVDVDLGPGEVDLDDEPVDAELVEDPAQPLRGEFVKRDGTTSETYEVDDDRSPIDGDAQEVEEEPAGESVELPLDLASDERQGVDEALSWDVDGWQEYAHDHDAVPGRVLRALREHAKAAGIAPPLHLADHHGDRRLVAIALDLIDRGGA